MLNVYVMLHIRKNVPLMLDLYPMLIYEETLMKCSEPGAIRDEELFAYLEGAPVRPAVLAHLAQCERCSSQLASYQRIELKLVKKLYRWDCPSNLTLGEYQLGLLDHEQATEILHHLHICTLCAAEVATCSEFLAHDALFVEYVPATTRQVSAPPASFDIFRLAKDVKQTLNGLHSQVQVGTRRIIAAFVPAPRFGASRDVVIDNPWPRSYIAEDMYVSLQIERSLHQRAAWQLLGFVTRQETALDALQGLPVLLTAQASSLDILDTQYIDELGNFVFDGLPSETYTLELQFPVGIIVVIDKLVIASSED